MKKIALILLTTALLSGCKMVGEVSSFKEVSGYLMIIVIIGLFNIIIFENDQNKLKEKIKDLERKIEDLEGKIEDGTS